MLDTENLKLLIASEYMDVQNWPGTAEAHHESNLLLLKDRRDSHLLKLAQRRSFEPDNLRQSNRLMLRSANRILLKETRACNKKIGNSYIARSLKIWNSIPEELKLITDLNYFKTRIKKEMLLNNLNFPEFNFARFTSHIPLSCVHAF